MHSDRPVSMYKERYEEENDRLWGTVRLGGVVLSGNGDETEIGGVLRP